MKLDDLLAVNAPLTAVYLLRDQRRTLWYADGEGIARVAWQVCAGMALASGIAEPLHFTRNWPFQALRVAQGHCMTRLDRDNGEHSSPNPPSRNSKVMPHAT